MAGLLIVCADEYAFIIALDNLLIDRAVEEYDGNVLRSYYGIRLSRL